MNFTSLPDDLNLDKDSPIQLFDFSVQQDLERKKIRLTKNTISFIQYGCRKIVADEEVAMVGQNDFVIMKSGKHLITGYSSPKSLAFKSILLFFTDEQVIDFMEKHKLSSRTFPKIIPFQVLQYDDYIRHFVESLEKILKLDRHLQMRLSKAKFEEIMLYLIQREGNEFLDKLVQNNDSKSFRLISTVERNRLEKMNLQELAVLCNMSLSTFKREFQKHYRMSPIKWFQEQRLEHAAFLLSTQKKRAIELYEAAGYENLSSFVQAFKRKYSTTPRQYQMNKLNL